MGAWHVLQRRLSDGHRIDNRQSRWRFVDYIPDNAPNLHLISRSGTRILYTNILSRKDQHNTQPNYREPADRTPEECDNTTQDPERYPAEK